MPDRISNYVLGSHKKSSLVFCEVGQGAPGLASEDGSNRASGPGLLLPGLSLLQYPRNTMVLLGRNRNGAQHTARVARSNLKAATTSRQHCVGRPRNR